LSAKTVRGTHPTLAYGKWLLGIFVVSVIGLFIGIFYSPSTQNTSQRSMGLNCSEECDLNLMSVKIFKTV
jgi:hypothetical protein